MGAELKEIDRPACLELLASGQIGRVVYTEAAMPAAHPVNYLLDGEEVVFRTGEGAKLAAASRGFVVGFQADEIDVEQRSGWSVHGVGSARPWLPLTGAGQLARNDEDRAMLPPQHRPGNRSSQQPIEGRARP